MNVLLNIMNKGYSPFVIDVRKNIGELKWNINLDVSYAGDLSATGSIAKHV